MTIIKTLRHLNKLFLPEELAIYADFFSYDIFKSIDSAEVYASKKIKFDFLISYLNTTKSREYNPDEIGNIGKVGKPIEFNKVDGVEKIFDFNIKGDTITAWLAGYSSPIRFEFFGDEIEKINLIDAVTGQSMRELSGIVLLKQIPKDLGEVERIFVNHSTSKNEGAVTEPRFRLSKFILTDKNIEDIEKFVGSKHSIINTDFEYPQLFFGNEKLFKKERERLENLGYTVLISGDNKINNSTLANACSKAGIPLKDKGVLELPAGFVSKSLKTAFFTNRELKGTIDLKNSESKELSSSKLKKILRQFEGEIEFGQHVVHEDYGVAIYAGLDQQEVEGYKKDYLLLKFADDDELYVPIDQIHKISKYLGVDSSAPKLSRLGKGNWKELKEKVKKKVMISAKELVKHYAKIEISKSKPIPLEDSKEYKKFVSAFPYEETDDQIKSINEINHDLSLQKPMNRLLVGDVGFGKTEVMMRAAFRVIENGGQVAVLCPTTVLASQHFDVFRQRLQDHKITKSQDEDEVPCLPAGRAEPGLQQRPEDNKEHPLRIKLLSRFNTPSENSKIVEELNKGKSDLVIGTHRLLSSDVQFKNLQLLIVDEEQRFGVKQKEKIKKLNYGVHVLNVSATPIPRSLNLALSSIQDISLITQPPEGRKPVETEIIFEDWQKASNAIQKEISRGGQVYFVHNRITTLEGIYNKLKSLIPDIKIEFAHGRMNPNKLDKIITSFYKKEFDVLLSTSIVENGLDLPNVNTIIIHDAHKFGMSQLYQMRGRVGRSERKAYCYLMVPKFNPTPSLPFKGEGAEGGRGFKSTKKAKAKKDKILERLETIVKNNDLGAGFKIASKDLEIRGAGNILGESQSGHINKIGYALYIEMLAKAIEGEEGDYEITRLRDYQYTNKPIH